MMAKHCRIVNLFISRVDSVFKLMPCVKNCYQQIPTIWIAVWLREDLASNQVRITKGGFFSESAICFFKSPKKKFQKTILSLKGLSFKSSGKMIVAPFLCFLR